MKRVAVLLSLLIFVLPVSAQEVDTPDAPAAAAVQPEGDPVADAGSDASSDVPAQADTTIIVPVEDPLDNPSTGDEVVQAAQKVEEAWHSRSFPAIAGAVIFLLLALFRLPLFGSLTSKIPQRIRILAAVGLSLVAAFFQVVALGASWGDALMNILGTAPTAVFANELIVESILGKRYQTKDGTKTA